MPDLWGEDYAPADNLGDGGLPPGVSDHHSHFDMPSTQSPRGSRGGGSLRDPEPKQPKNPMTSLTPQGPQLPSVDLGDEMQFPLRPTLRIDSGSGNNTKLAGTWNYLDVPIYNVHLIVASAVQTRSLFLKDYNEDPKAPLVCSSWNGDLAFGTGQRSADKKLLRERVCEECPSGKWAKLPNGKNSCLCPTSWLLFGMLLHKESDVWMPYLWHAGGLNAKPAGKAWADVCKASLTTTRRVAGSESTAAQKSKWVFAAPAQLLRNKDQRGNVVQGYTAEFGAFSEIPDVDKQMVARFLATTGAVLWKREKQSLEDRARKVLAEDADAPEEGIKDPTDYGQVPF